MENDDAKPQQQATKKRRRRTRRAQPPADGDASAVADTDRIDRTNTVYQLDITDLQDDVVSVDTSSQTRLEINTQRSLRFRENQTASFIPSLESELIFIEQRSGFRTQTVEELQSQQAARNNLAAMRSERMRNEANTRIVRNTLSSHIMFSRLSHLFEGLLAGFALYHFMVLVYNLLLGGQSTVSFIISYAPMAQIYTGTLHCFLAFATLRSFYPIEYLRRITPISSTEVVPTRRAVLIRNLPLIVIYLTAVALNASLDSVSRQFSLVGSAPGVILQRRFALQIQPTVESFWLPASMSLCLLILLGWCISTLAPSADRTKQIIENRVVELSRFITPARGTTNTGVNSVYSA